MIFNAPEAICFAHLSMPPRLHVPRSIDGLSANLSSVHLGTSMKWLGFGVQRSKVTSRQRRPVLDVAVEFSRLVISYFNDCFVINFQIVHF